MNNDSESNFPEIKDHSLEEIGQFNIFTNQYIQNLQMVDPVLAGIVKRAILYAFDSESKFEGTMDELNTLLNTQLNPNPTPSGFCKLLPISTNLANWLHLESPIEMTGPELTKHVWNELKSRNLVYDQNTRIFRCDEESAQLFGLNMEIVNASTDHRDQTGFNFCNLQRYVQQANRNAVN